MERWFLLDDGAAPAAWNMALDEFLLGMVQRKRTAPVLLLYSFDPPAITLGYHEDPLRVLDMRSIERDSIDVASRFTGGRALLHDDELTYCIVGPPTNVLNSWHTLAEVLGLRLTHVMPEELSAEIPLPWRQRMVSDKRVGLSEADVVLTDAWPENFHDRRFRLTLDDLAVVNEDAWVIPCPPFNTAKEIADDVIASKFFAGYRQKAALYPVQRAIIQHLVGQW